MLVIHRPFRSGRVLISLDPTDRAGVGDSMQQSSDSARGIGPHGYSTGHMPAPQLSSTTQVAPPLKRPWLCAMLSLLMPGSGLIVAGRLVFGVAYLLLVLTFIVTSGVAFIGGLFGTFFYGLDGASRGVSRDFEVLVSMVALYGSPAVLGLAVAVWIASIVHAGLAARRWNREHAGAEAARG